MYHKPINASKQMDKPSRNNPSSSSGLEELLGDPTYIMMTPSENADSGIDANMRSNI
jgi:hypothetical protein